MTKEELVKQAADNTGLPAKTVRLALDGILKAAADALAGKQQVRLRGFGSLKVRKRAAREGKNPRTGKTIRIPAREVPVFFAADCLKQRLQRRGTAE